MSTEDTSATRRGSGSNDLLGQAPERVTPRAWAIFVDSGNARMWSTLQPHVQKLADAEGLEVTPLYDQAALEAAIEAAREQERGRWEGVVFDGWRVLKGLDDAAAKRTTHQNVSDTLDALMRVLRPNVQIDLETTR